MTEHQGYGIIRLRRIPESLVFREGADKPSSVLGGHYSRVVIAHYLH